MTDNLTDEDLKAYDIYPPEEYAPMHEWLTGFEKYNVSLPVPVESPLSPAQVERLHAIFNWHKTLKPTGVKPMPGHQEIIDKDVRVPRQMIELSRQIIDFILPREIEQVIDSIIKPMYDGEIVLSHYNYLDYNVEYGNNDFIPALQPHLDASNALLTFNYMIDGNIDWQVCVDDTCYDLKPGDAIVFSAVNQVHWRPKRKWKAGEFVKIITLNYSPADDWVFTGKRDPIDPFTRIFERRKHGSEFQSTFAYARAFEKYQLDGLRDGIPLDQWGLLMDDNDNLVSCKINSKSEHVADIDHLFNVANSPENIKLEKELEDPKNKKYIK